MTRRTFKIDKHLLLRNDACEDGLAFFEEHFPEGFLISNDQDEMTEFIVKFFSSIEEDPFDRANAEKYISWLTETIYDGEKYESNYYDLFVNKNDTDHDKNYCKTCRQGEENRKSFLKHDDPIVFATLLSDSLFLKQSDE